mgnify:FL=1
MVNKMKEIENRRSIRNFKNEKISKDLIVKIIESGILSPSAKNKQPWYYIVVNEEIKNKISLKLENVMGKNKTSDVIKEAPVLILVYNTLDDYYSHMSIGSSIENMLLEAESNDIGSLWIGYVKKIEEYINNLVDCNYELISAIALGVKNEQPPKRPRKSFDEVCKFIN